jgi:hypothetical protein
MSIITIKPEHLEVILLIRAFFFQPEMIISSIVARGHFSSIAAYITNNKRSAIL